MAFLFISFTLPFSSQLFSRLYPKQQSSAASIYSTSLGNELRKENTQLIALLTQLNSQSTGDVSSLLTNIQQRATIRRDKLIELLELKPNAIQENKIPEVLLTELPKDTRDLFEKNATVEGDLEVVHTLNSDNTTDEVSYYLRTYDEKRYHLIGSDGTILLLPGMVKASGFLLDKYLAINDNSAIEATALPHTLSIGRRSVTAIPFDFQDLSGPNDRPAKLKSNLEVARTLFETQSMHNLTLAGTTTDLPTIYLKKTIDSSSLNCDPSLWKNQLGEVIKEDDSSALFGDISIFVMPHTSSCDWSIKTSTSGEIWINGDIKQSSVLSSLGYAIGAGSAHATVCTKPIRNESEYCDISLFSDPYSVMSENGMTFSIYDKYRLGWISSSAIAYHVGDVDKEYSLISDSDSTTPADTFRGIIIPISSSDELGGYYVEYRPDLSGLLIYKADSINSARGNSYLVDVTSDTKNNWSDANVTTTQSFTDEKNGLTISLNSMSSNQATVQVVTTPTRAKSWDLEIGLVCPNHRKPVGTYELVDRIVDGKDAAKTVTITSDLFTYSAERSDDSYVRQVGILSVDASEYLTLSLPLPSTKMKLGSVGAPNSESIQWSERELPSRTEPYSLTFIVPDSQCQ